MESVAAFLPPLPFSVPDSVRPLVTVVIFGHIMVIGLLICCGLAQDTRPDWLKEAQKKKAS